MEFNINPLTDSEKEIEVTLSYDEIKKDIESEVLKQTKKIQLPGFRKGKAPLSMLKKMYGDALEYEASEKVANTKFWQIVKDENLNPIGQPHLADIKFDSGKTLYFKVHYEVYPEIEVKDYTNLDIEVPDYTISEKEVDHEIEHILKANATHTSEEVVGDDNHYLLKVEFQRVNENQEDIPDSKPEIVDIDLTNPQVHQEIKDNVKGKKTGDYFTFSFTDQRKVEKEGKEETVSESFQYKGKILEIKRTILPELNEELVKKVTKERLKTEQELRDDIEKGIKNFYEQKKDEFLRDKLIKEIIKNNDFTPPVTLVNNVIEDMIKREEEESKKHGQKNVNKDLLKNYFTPVAETEVKWFLIKNAIEKKESIATTQEELQALAEKDSEKTSLPVDKLLKFYESSNYSEKMADKKLFEFLKERNNIKFVEPEKLSQNETKEKNE